jgi:hypothetical protein
MFKNRKPDTATHWSIFDGRQLCGTIDKINSLFTARGADGALIGTFPNPRAAAQAFDVADDETLATTGTGDRRKRG